MHQFGVRVDVVVLLAVATLFAAASGEPQVVHRYAWEVNYFKFSPDCNETLKDVLGVRQTFPVEIKLEEFPGPTIRVRAGDRLEVTVTNKITKANPGKPKERVAIHWHGVRQKGTPWEDGAPGLTECGIPQFGSYTYNFTVDRAGTYLWHGHDVAQRAAGLYGLLIVEQRLFAVVPTYDGEFALMVTDWWHTDIYTLTNALSNPRNWSWVGNPNAFLIKGASMAPCTGPYTCAAAELECKTNNLQPQLTGAGTLIMNVEPGKTYLIRIASATSLGFVNFVVEGHAVTVVEADGHRVQPFVTTSVDILSGQTYSVELTTKLTTEIAGYPDQRAWHVGVNARDQVKDSTAAKGTDPGLAVLSYNIPYINKTAQRSLTNATSLWEYQPTIMLGGPEYNDTQFSYYFARDRIRALVGYSYPVPQGGDINLTLLISQIQVVDNPASRVMRWAINGISYDFPEGRDRPLLARLMDGEAVRQLDSSFDLRHVEYSIFERRAMNQTSAAVHGGYYKLNRGNIVTVVLQNAAMFNSSGSEAHPWHLHGHDFWVLGYGNGIYDPETSPEGFNLVDPPVRNTVAVFAYGWVAIRFIADNPGVWSFHCHNEWHMYQGMKVVFAYGVDSIAKNTKILNNC